MIVPQFWAEGRARGRRDGRQVTVRRFGWSDVSQEEAQANADARAAEALRRVLSGEVLDRREPKVPYNGAVGVPIREEVVSRHGDVVITRNSYGARCLNSPNALFADIDFPTWFSVPVGCALISVVMGASAVVMWLADSPGWTMALAAVAILAALPVVAWVRQVSRRVRADPETAARDRVARFAEDYPDWSMRVYRTPAGLRLLVTHRPFDPSEPDVRAFFAAVGADPMYVRMCLNQQCFRARVSPKPWRVGIGRHMKPRPGVWPVRLERMPDRLAWVAEYEAAAVRFAACEFIDTVGSGVVHPQLAAVVKLHDDMSRATSGLPIA